MELIRSPPTYHTSAAQKARSKSSAHHRFKYGSPKLVDMMREKCRLRIKEARNEHLLRKRNIVQEEKALLESIVREELSELEQDIQLQELIFQELIAETDEWLFEEYERSGSYMIDEYGEEVVFCPVCQKDKLCQAEQEVVRCSCGTTVRCPGGVEQMGRMLQVTVEEHGMRCEAEVQFFIEPGLVDRTVQRLNVFCPSCDYYKNLTN